MTRNMTLQLMAEIRAAAPFASPQERERAWLERGQTLWLCTSFKGPKT